MRKPFYYVVLPAVVSAVLLGMYFSGHIVPQRLVSPKLPPLPPDSWREFGLLENIQHAILLGIVGIAAAAMWLKKAAIERVGFGIVLAFAVFLFLEEIDYGMHYKLFLAEDRDYGWFQPVSEWPREVVRAIDWRSEPFNLHNIGALNSVFKNLANAIIALCFFVLPLVAVRRKNRWIRYLAPDPWAAGTVLCMLVVRFAAHTMGDMEKAAISAGADRELGSISNNLSEFRELLVYYLGLIYLVTLVFHRRSPLDAGAEQAGEGS